MEKATDRTHSGPSEPPVPVVLDASSVFTIFSPLLDQTFRIQVRLPGSYHTQPNQHYPLIIKIDGQWDFPLAACIYNNLYFDGQMPETLVLGIEWADIEGDVHAIRARDLLPAPVSFYSDSGHADRFVEAFETDIIPQLQALYRLNGQYYLLGGSWGATFANYALLARPSLFAGAIAIAADYKSAASVFSGQIEALRPSSALQGRRLYIGVGKGDQVAQSVLAYAAQLAQADLAGFSLKVVSLEGFGHSGMNVPGFAGGYQFLFQRPQLVLAADHLRRFVGTYRAQEQPDQEWQIQADQQGLMASNRWHAIPLCALSTDSFYAPGEFLNLNFSGDRVEVETFFGRTEYRRSHQD